MLDSFSLSLATTKADDSAEAARKSSPTGALGAGMKFVETLSLFRFLAAGALARAGYSGCAGPFGRLPVSRNSKAAGVPADRSFEVMAVGDSPTAAWSR